jgi:hypothetical protein
MFQSPVRAASSALDDPTLAERGVALLSGCSFERWPPNIDGPRSFGLDSLTPAQGPDAAQSEATSGIQQNDLAAGNFFQRLGSFYNHDSHGTLPAAAQTGSRRALEAPLDSPPYPSSDWGYGGSSTVGVPDGNTYC